MIVALVVSAASASAQQGRPTTAPPARPTVSVPVEAQGTPAPARAAAPFVDPRVDQSDVNIGVTVNITDKSPTSTQNKVVSLIVANRNSGRVRSSGMALVQDRERSSDLNVDARTVLMKSGMISVDLTINYIPEWTSDTTKMTSVTQSVTLFLKDGQPTLITQAADPTHGTRSVSIEVTAKVIK
jgi:hypothetical protein